MSNLSEKAPNKEQKKPNQKGLAMGAIALTLAATIISGCTANAKAGNTPPKSKATVESVSGSEKKAEASASEQHYAQYLETLSPKQREVRESLDPDKLAIMDDSQISEAFTIHTDEVMVDGKVDPNLYAEAFAARFQAIYSTGVSQNEYSKWGGIDTFGTDVVAKVAAKYSPIETKALYGYEGNSTALEAFINAGHVVDFMLKSNMDTKPTERYHFRVTVQPGSSSIVQHNGGSFDIKFTVIEKDNWDKKVMETGETIDDVNTWTIDHIRIEDNKLIPAHVIMPESNS